MRHSIRKNKYLGLFCEKNQLRVFNWECRKESSWYSCPPSSGIRRVGDNKPSYAHHPEHIDRVARPLRADSSPIHRHGPGARAGSRTPHGAAL